MTKKDIIKGEALSLSNRGIQSICDLITIQLSNDNPLRAYDEFMGLKRKVNELGQHILKLQKENGE